MRCPHIDIRHQCLLVSSDNDRACGISGTHTQFTSRSESSLSEPCSPQSVFAGFGFSETSRVFPEPGQCVRGREESQHGR